MIFASPAKLRDGSWGAKILGSAQVGQMITIRTQAGKTWSATVSNVIWSGNGITLVSTRSNDSHSPSSSHRPKKKYGAGRCSECGEFLKSWMDGYSAGLCHDCI